MNPTYVFIVCSMRSGSTLLKALIATRKDVAHFTEMPFTEALNISHTKPFILIKKPAFLGEFNYPQLPNINSKKIILIRNPKLLWIRIKRN